MILILIYNVKITIEYISAFKLFYVDLKKKTTNFLKRESLFAHLVYQQKHESKPITKQSTEPYPPSRRTVDEVKALTV